MGFDSQWAEKIGTSRIFWACQPERSDFTCGIVQAGKAPVRFSARFSLFFVSSKMAQLVFRFVFGSLFPQLRVFNNFSASFSGSVRFVFWPRSFVFSNFSGSFFKKGILFCFLLPETG